MKINFERWGRVKGYVWIRKGHTKQTNSGESKVRETFEVRSPMAKVKGV